MEFDYLIKKVQDAEFSFDPFKHIIIDDFLSGEHFERVVTSKEIVRPEYSSTKELLEDLINIGYEIIQFPGCIQNIKDYLKYLESEPENKPNHHKEIDINTKGLLEGFGMTLRLMNSSNYLLKELGNFANSEKFRKCLMEKFEVDYEHKIDVETAIQKYLQGYEISPHPDLRKKALTFMLNLNTHPDAEKSQIHTYLLRFKKQYQYIYEFWSQNLDIDRNWVPWDWCDIVKEASRNNSIVIFAPSNDTLHAVKLNYNHLKFQRTQLYGNLWFDNPMAEYESSYKSIDLVASHKIKAGEYIEINSSKSLLRKIIRIIERKYL